MKRTEVVQPKPAFVPFNLLIETEDEARLLSTLLGNCPWGIETGIGLESSPAYSMYVSLKEFNDPRFDITITLNKETK